MICVNTNGELVHVDKYHTETNIKGLRYEDIWWFFCK
jgi:hypothetical protein